MYVTIVPEGPLEEYALRRIIAHTPPNFKIYRSLLRRTNPNRRTSPNHCQTTAAGRDSLRLNIHGYLNAAKKAGRAQIVLCDLERDYPCAPKLLEDWNLAGKMPDNFIFNVAVRSTEAWLLADKEKIASFLYVSEARIPAKPDELEHPKNMLTNIAAKSRSSIIRAAFKPKTNGQVGSEYLTYMVDYIQNHWRIDNAAEASPSLSRVLERLRHLEQLFQTKRAT